MYGTIYADPPWLERGGGKIKRGADRHYPLMKTEDICELKLTYNVPVLEGVGGNSVVEVPVREVGLLNSHLWLWVTNNFLEDGLEVMKAWGYRYITNLVWVKDKIGLGQYLRGQHELLLFGVRGHVPYKLTPEGGRVTVPSVYLAPRGRHSAKPEMIRRDVVEAISPGPYIELFARSKVPGWDVWGNEVPNAEDTATEVVG